MGNQIILKNLENKVIVEGVISSIVYQGSLIGELIKDFASYSVEEKKLTITDNAFYEEKKLNEFQKNFKELLIDTELEIILDESFLSKITSFEEDEELFSDFSAKALSIWSSAYETEELKAFSKTIEKNLPTRKLYKLQLLSSFHLSFSQNACNFSVPGAGKTSIVYGAFSFLNSLEKTSKKYVNKLMIIGPPSSFKPWEDEYLLCFGVKPSSIRLNSETNIKERISSLSGQITDQHNLFLITYNSVPTLIEYLIRFCNSNKNKVMLVCDEAHKIKNLGGTWSSNVLRLAPYASSRVVLTGTPLPNGYEDLVNLFRFIYPNRDVVGFRPDYLRTLNSSPYSSHVEALINNIRPFFIRIKKTDLNLPSVTSDKINKYPPSVLEKKIYNKLLAASKNISGDFKKEGLHLRLVQSIYNAKLLTKKNFDSHGEFQLTDSQLNIKQILGAKLFDEIDALDENYNPSRHFSVLSLTKNIVSNGGKVVIWGVFIDSIKRLHKLLSKNGLKGSIVIGETKKQIKGKSHVQLELTRENIIESFKQKQGGLDYIITNPVVLGESISLHKICHHSIYFELSYSAAPYIQSRDRIHRVWLRNNKQEQYETHYYHFISDEIIKGVTNIDLEIFNVLRRKWKRMLEIINQDIPLLTDTDDNERVNTINKIINEYRRTRL